MNYDLSERTDKRHRTTCPDTFDSLYEWHGSSFLCTISGCLLELAKIVVMFLRGY
jgi:hypothetical protein